MPAYRSTTGDPIGRMGQGDGRHGAGRPQAAPARKRLLSHPFWAVLGMLVAGAAGIAVWESDWMLERQAARADREQIGVMATQMPGSAIVQYYYARQWARAGDLVGATAAIERARAADPSSARVVTLYADLLERQARFPEAAVLLHDFAPRHPNEAEAHYALGVYYYRVFAKTQAVQELQHAVRLAPADVGAWRVLGEACLAAGLYPDAIRAYGKALDLEPGDYGTLLRRGKAHVEAHDLDPAEADLRAAVKAAPAALDARYALAEMLARYRPAPAPQKESEQILRGLLAGSADVTEARRELGRVLGNQGRWQEAETELRAYTTARPADPEGLFLYAGALRRQHKPDNLMRQQFRAAKAAEERWRTLLIRVQSEPNNFRARLELARLLARRGEVAFAILSYERALRLAPNDAGARHELAALKTRFQGGDASR